MRRVLLAALAVLLAVGVVLVPVAVVAQDGATNATDAGNETAAGNETGAAGDESGYTLEELKDDGRNVGTPSLRIVPDDHRMYWLEYVPPNKPWKDVTKADHGPKFPEEGHLETDSIYLRTLIASYDTESLNVTIVVWEQDTKTVKDGNTTTEEQVAKNVTVHHQTVQMEPGEAVAEVTLPSHHKPVEVTMWIDGRKDEARWRFTHHSTAWTQPMNINTGAEFTAMAFGMVVIPALAFGWWSGPKVRQWVDEAGPPPSHGFTYYLIILTIVTALVVSAAYRFVAELVVGTPIVLGIYVGLAYLGHALSTHTDKGDKLMLWKGHIEAVETFAQSRIPDIGAGTSESGIEFNEDMPIGQLEEITVLQDGKGLSIIKDSWMAWLARKKGGRAIIENASELRTRMQLHASEWSEVIFVHPNAEQMMDYKPPGLRLKTPEVESWHDLVWPVIIYGSIAGLAYRLTGMYGAQGWALLAVGVPYLVWRFAVTGTDSHVHIPPAPAHLRSVLATMLMANIGLKDAENLKQAEQLAFKALAGKDTEELDRVRNRNETYLEETFNDNRPDDPELTTEDEDDEEWETQPSEEVDTVAGASDDD